MTTLEKALKHYKSLRAAGVEHETALRQTGLAFPETLHHAGAPRSVYPDGKIGAHESLQRLNETRLGIHCRR
jgi:hypothetical protein